MVKVEFQNSRYLGPQLREYMAEFIHYSKYAGVHLNDFHRHLSQAQLKPLGSDAQQPINRIIVETTQENLNKIQHLIEAYPVFNTWKIRLIGNKGKLAVVSKKPKASNKAVSKKKPAVTKKKTATQSKKSAASKKKTVKKSKVKTQPAKKKVEKKANPAKAKKAKPKTKARITVERVLISSSRKKAKSKSAKVKAKPKTKKSPTRKSR